MQWAQHVIALSLGVRTWLNVRTDGWTLQNVELQQLKFLQSEVKPGEPRRQSLLIESSWGLTQRLGYMTKGQQKERNKQPISRQRDSVRHPPSFKWLRERAAEPGPVHITQAKNKRGGDAHAATQLFNDYNPFKTDFTKKYIYVYISICIERWIYVSEKSNKFSPLPRQAAAEAIVGFENLWKTSSYLNPIDTRLYGILASLGKHWLQNFEWNSRHFGALTADQLEIFWNKGPRLPRRGGLGSIPLEP